MPEPHSYTHIYLHTRQSVSSCRKSFVTLYRYCAAVPFPLKHPPNARTCPPRAAGCRLPALLPRATGHQYPPNIRARARIPCYRTAPPVNFPALPLHVVTSHQIFSCVAAFAAYSFTFPTTGEATSFFPSTNKHFLPSYR